MGKSFIPYRLRAYLYQPAIHKDREINLGEKNPMWKGDKVGSEALHEWVNKHKPFPLDGQCEICHHKKFIDLANMTGIYNREFGNWMYLCRRCHMISDGRMNNLKQYQKKEVI